MKTSAKWQVQIFTPTFIWKITVFLDPFPSFPIYVASNIGSLATSRGHQSHGQLAIPMPQPLLQIQILSHKVDVGYARIGVVDHMNCWSCLPWAAESTKIVILGGGYDLFVELQD